MKKLFKVSDKDLPGFEFPTGNPLVIKLADGSIEDATENCFGLHLAERLQFVGLRFRVYVLMVLLPILATLLARDAASLAEQLPEIWRITAFISGSVLILALFPLLMLIAWKHGPIEDVVLRLKLLDSCRRLKLGVRTIRAWHTGGQIINAVVAGVIPGLRVIVISDAMLGYFPQRELLAVVRHEAGHIRMSHMPIRMFFLLFPLILAAIDQTNGAMVANFVTTQFELLSLTSTHAVLASAIVYLLYLLATLTWLSHQMEFEADWFSVMSEQTNDDARNDVEQQADALLAEHDSMTLAIARLAAHSPEQFERRTLMHPSLKERMQRTARLAEHRISARQLASVTSRRSSLVRIVVVAAVCAFILRSVFFCL